MEGNLALNRGPGLLDWAIIGVYFITVIAIGWYYSRRQKSKDDFLLGGRRTNAVASGISIIVTLTSLISYLAVVGETVKYGPVFVFSTLLALPIIYLLATRFLLPVFMKLPITSAYELLENPLGLKARLTGSVIFILTRVAWMALLVFLSAKTLVVMMNWDSKLIVPIILALGVITLVYSALGGFKAAVATGVIKFFLLFLGAVLTIVFVTVKMGGAGAWIPGAWASHWQPLVLFSFDPRVRITLIGMILTSVSWWVCTAGSDQIAIQRYLSTRNLKEARKAFLSNNIADAVLTIFLGLTGFAILGFFSAYPHLASEGRSVSGEADFLFPHLIANILPHGAAGLLLAGVLSVVLVSFSSGINSTAAVITTDFLERLGRKKGTARDHPGGGGPESAQGLKSSRIATLAVGVIVMLLSTIMDKVPGNIIEVTNRTNGLFVAPLFNLFFMAIFVRKASGLGTIFGSAYGFVTAFLVGFWETLTGRTGPGFQWIIPFSLVSSVLFSMVFSLLIGRNESRRAARIWSLALAAPLLLAAAWIFVVRGG